MRARNPGAARILVASAGAAVEADTRLCDSHNRYSTISTAKMIAQKNGKSKFYDPAGAGRGHESAEVVLRTRWQT
jgi:hypothetical protein